MTNATAFVNGASRGLGEAIVKALLEADFSHIIAISRSKNASLDRAANDRGATIEWMTADLSSEEDAARKFGPVFDKHNTGTRDPIVLINNAGVVEPIGPLGSVDSGEVAQNLRINLAAPALLCNEFLRALAGTDSRRVIINVTSGLAKRAMTGVAAYSTAKAGLDMLTTAIATEQAQHFANDRSATAPVEVYAVSPGTVATDMQKALRASSESELPDKSKFVSLFERGELYTSAIFKGAKQSDPVGTSMTRGISGKVAIGLGEF